MRAKLKSYAKDQLPGGKYWDPPNNIAKVLKEIQPSNDVCESILGLNDWLQTRTSSLSQLTKRNIIEAKKNQSLQWLETLSGDKQAATINMAQTKRSEVKLMERQHALDIKEARRLGMMRDIEKQYNKDKIATQRRQEMEHMLIIDSPQQLDRILKAIDNDKALTGTQKTEKETDS
jgi:hypothetical protein